MATAVSYVIFLTDLTRVQSLNATYPSGIQIPPNAAAATFGVPGPAQGTNNLNQTGGIGIFPDDSVGFSPDLSPSYGTETFTVTYTDLNPAPPGFPDPYPFTLSCYWVGTFAYSGALNTVPPPSKPQRYLGKRRWICGFEVPTLGDGGSGQGTHTSRDGSRTTDGMGYVYRNQNNSANRTQALPASVTVSWERFYIRIRNLPSGGDDNIWFAHGSGEGGASILLNINTTGTLQGYFKGNAAYPGQSAGVSTALTVGTWYRIDLRLEFLTGSPTARLDVYINGVLSFSGTGTNNAAGQTHSNSNIGEDVSATANGLEIDYDDWNNAEEVSITDPVSGIVTKYPGNDLTTGSHIVLVRPSSFNSAHQTASWQGVGAGVAGVVQEVNNFADPSGVTNGLTSTTPSAKIVVNTDYARQQSGATAATIGVWPWVSPGSMQLGINALPLQTVAFGASWDAISNYYTIASGSTADALPDLGPFTMTFVSNSGAGTTTIVGLFGTVEFIGAWGPEDTVSALNGAYPVRAGIHNNPYPSLRASRSTLAPVGALRIAAGTYSGNNIGQDIFEKIAAHWWWVRPVSGYTTGGAWYSSMIGPHDQLAERIRPEIMPQALLDVQGNAKAQVAGSGGQWNATGTVYQYVAVSDVAMRYLINGAFAHKNNVASFVNSLIDTGFSPDALFVAIESFTLTTTGHFFKGPGNTTDHACQLDTGDVAGIASMAAGAITSKTTLHTDSPQTAFSAWRKSDGSVSCPWIDIITYTGDGTGNRNIAVSLGGKFPLFVLVTPHNAAGFFRDPSHTGTNSSQIGVGSSATAIIGGAANQVQVGATLNANGIVYELLVIGGSTTTAFANGIFTSCVENQRTGGAGTPWVANPAQTTINPVSIVANTQWQIQRFDMKPRREEHR